MIQYDDIYKKSMPTKNFLSSKTKETLQQALKEHEHADIRQRALTFLLLKGNLVNAV